MNALKSKVVPRLLILVVLAFAALAIRQYVVNRSARADRIAFDRILMCTECGVIWGANLDTAMELPTPCPNCGKKTGGFAYRCDECGKTFAYVPEPFTHPTCPACGSTKCSRLEEVPPPEEDSAAEGESPADETAPSDPPAGESQAAPGP